MVRLAVRDLTLRVGGPALIGLLAGGLLAALREAKGVLRPELFVGLGSAFAYEAYQFRWKRRPDHWAIISDTLTLTLNVSGRATKIRRSLYLMALKGIHELRLPLDWVSDVQVETGKSLPNPQGSARIGPVEVKCEDIEYITISKSKQSHVLRIRLRAAPASRSRRQLHIAVKGLNREQAGVDRGPSPYRFTYFGRLRLRIEAPREELFAEMRAHGRFFLTPFDLPYATREALSELSGPAARFGIEAERAGMFAIEWTVPVARSGYAYLFDLISEEGDGDWPMDEEDQPAETSSMT